MESINRPEDVKEHNLNLVRERLFQLREATRQQLSAATGISTVTLGSLLAQLIEAGDVLESEMVPTSGRPARVYSFNARQKFGLLTYIAFEKGGRVRRSALIDLYGETVWEESVPAVDLNEEETRRFFDLLLHLRGPVGAVGIGLPGVGFGEYLVNRNRQHFSLSAIEELERFTGISFCIENDVNLSAVGYAKRHRVKPEETMAYLQLTKGAYPGSAIYINGRLHPGKNRFAGEMAPPPYGLKGDALSELADEALTEALFRVCLPYLTVLAPHRLVFAGDLVTPEQMEAVKLRAIEVLGESNAPDFYLSNDPLSDYREGLKQIILEGYLWKKNGKAWI